MAEFLFPNVRIVVTFLLSVGIAYVAWQNRPKQGATLLSAFMLVVAYLQAHHLFMHFYEHQWGLYIYRLRHLGLGVIAFLFFAFVVAYIGRGDLLTRRTYAALLAWPVFLNVALWTPTVTGALGQPVGASLVEGFMLESNWLFWGHVGLSYGLLLVSTGLVVRHMFRTNDLVKVQGAVLSFGLFAVWAGSVVSVFGFLGGLHLHSLQLGFAILGMSFFVGVYFGGIADVVPVARSTILGTLAVGVLVVDEDGTLTDVNPHARRMLDLGSTVGVLGQSVDRVLADHPDLRDAIADLDDGSRELEVATAEGSRTVELDVSPLSGRTDRRIGKAVLLYDVTSQRRRQRELERRNQQLEQFASLVSHDLRNPLTVADGYLINAKEMASRDDLVATLEEIEASHGRMQNLIEDVLTLAREGRTVTDAEPVSVDEVAYEAWGQVDTRDATLAVQTDAPVRADRSRLLRAFENLFRNAVDHGGEGVTVRVGALPTTEATGPGAGPAGIFVEDDGPGIPDDRREQVLEDGFTTADDGTGLGLSIVTSIVDAHGWAIDLTESDGGGARFEITTTTPTEAEPTVAEV